MAPRTTVSTDWTFQGFRTVLIENSYIRLVVLPEIGAKIHALISKRVDRNLLYTHPRIELRRPVFGANVDDYWTGGIDDVLPAGHACIVGDETLPFLGEAWSLAWAVDQVAHNAVTFRRSGIITPFAISRTVELLDDQPLVRLSYEISNIGLVPFDFLWAIHAGFPLSETTQLSIPAKVGVVDRSWPDARLGAPGTTYDWPHSALMPGGRSPEGTWDLHYATALGTGLIELWDSDWRGGVRMRFDDQILNTVWVWVVDGGWRGVRCMAVEPATGYPARLDEATTAGRASRLSPGERMSATMDLIVFEGGVDRVRRHPRTTRED
jgi:hypothetical protein